MGPLPLSLAEIKYRFRLAKLWFELMSLDRWNQVNGALTLLLIVFGPLTLFFSDSIQSWGAKYPRWSIGLILGYLTIVTLYLLLTRSIGSILKLAASSQEKADLLMRDYIQVGLQSAKCIPWLQDIYKPIVEGSQEPKLEMSAEYAAVFVRLNNKKLQDIAEMRASEPRPRMANLYDLVVDAQERQDFARTIRQKPGKVVADIETGDNYCLVEMLSDANNPHSKLLMIGVATYGEILRSCDCLIEEWGLFCSLAKDLDLERKQILRCVPWRRRLLKKEGLETFRKPSGRYAGVGMAACTCLDMPDGPQKKSLSQCFIMGFRSSEVSTYIRKSHVAPAGMCNTKRLHNEEDYFLINIGSEFLEEIFAMEEFETLEGDDWRDKVRNEMRRRAEESGLSIGSNWDIELTGICFDLMNLRPEICVLIRFRGPGFYNAYSEMIKPNYEYDRGFHYPRKQSQQKMSMSDSMQNDLSDSLPRPIGSRWVQSGAVSFMLGTERVYGIQRRV